MVGQTRADDYVGQSPHAVAVGVAPIGGCNEEIMKTLVEIEAAVCEHPRRICSKVTVLGRYFEDIVNVGAQVPRLRFPRRGHDRILHWYSPDWETLTTGYRLSILCLQLPFYDSIIHLCSI